MPYPLEKFIDNKNQYNKVLKYVENYPSSASKLVSCLNKIISKASYIQIKSVLNFYKEQGIQLVAQDSERETSFITFQVYKTENNFLFIIPTGITLLRKSWIFLAEDLTKDKDKISEYLGVYKIENNVNLNLIFPYLKDFHLKKGGKLVKFL